MGQYVIYALAFVLVITVVVGIHEGGHFLSGKASGIRVDEFSIGFGPRLLSTTRGETRYSIRLLPLGGFVRMAGMLGLEGEADAGERNFYRAAMPKRLVTIAAGILANLVLAIVCFTIVNVAAATPWAVLPKGPAARAGIPDGARITAVDGTPVRDDNETDVSQDLHHATEMSKGAVMQVTFESPSGGTRTVPVKPELVVINPVQSGSGGAPVGVLVVASIDGHQVTTGDPAALLSAGGSAQIAGYRENTDGSPGPAFSGTVAGVGDGYGSSATQPQAAWLLGVEAGSQGQPLPSAVANAALAIPQFVQTTATNIYDLITQPKLGGVNGPNGLSGPVGIAEATAAVTQNGWLSTHGIVWWIGFISMNLGIINVLPIPFLDGGKLLFLGIESARRKRLDPRFEAAASAVGLGLIVLLLIYVTIGDVGRTL